MSQISFTPFLEEHLPYWFRWAETEHVKSSWFQEGYEPPEYIHKKIEGNGYDYPYAILLDGEPIGYIQCSDLYAYRTLSPEPEGVFTNEPKGTYCIDIFIGEEELLNQGLGTRIMQAFCPMLLEKPEVERLVIDPSADDARAIRCYEKVGFRPIREEDDGTNLSLVMEYSLPIDQLRPLWNLDEDIEFIRKTANFVYKAHSRGKPLILKVSSPFRRSFESIEAEVEWVDFLHANGIHVAAPIRSIDGRLAVPLEGGEEPLTATAFAFAPGHLATAADLAPQFLHKLGAEMGRLHSVTSTYPLSEEHSARHNWTGQIWPTADRYRDLGLDPTTAARLMEMVHVLERRSKTPQTYGLIHGDLHPDNLFVTDDLQLTIFDFDACCYHWFLYDVATTIVHAHEYFWRHGVEISREELSDSLLAGYRNVRPIDTTDLPFFLEFRTLAFICWARVQLALHRSDPAGERWIRRVLEWISNP